MTELGYTKYRLSRFIVHGKRQNESFPVWICSGTLINQWFVLTAAHCLRSRERKVRNVRVGDWLVKDDPYDPSQKEEGPQLPEPQVMTAVITELFISLALIELPSDGEQLYSVRRTPALPG